MEYRTLGATDLKVSVIGYGTWGIGGWGARDDDEALRALDAAFDKGINFYDTAYVYGDGHSEELLGEAFRKKRDDVIIATKIPPKTFRWPVKNDDPIEKTFPKDWIITCTETSLRRLKTDYVDIQQLHAWPEGYVDEDVWLEAMSELQQQGKVRYYGVSAHDWDPYGATRLVETGTIHSVQVIYNIFEQRPEEQLLPAALAKDVGIIARVPFEEGLLTGTIGPKTRFPKGDWRADWLTPKRLKEASDRVERLREFLTEDWPTLPMLALKFCLSHPAVSTVIPGMRRAAHVEANVKAAEGPLLAADVREALAEHAFVHGWMYPWAVS